MNQVMSWGTPRLVTRGLIDQKNSTFRSIHLNENNLKQREMLVGISNIRNGNYEATEGNNQT